MTEHTTRRRLLRGGSAALALGVAGLGRTSSIMQTQHSTTNSTAHVRAVAEILRAQGEHWVGDGFRVRSVISPNGDPKLQSPFLLLDHAPRRNFAPASERRGVGEHPHRGFETVTFAYRGEIEHRDSAGGGGLIGPGDVQWMTAAGGVVHEEMHSRRFTEQGGELEMVQLWVNLPAKDKLAKPGYQALLDKDFPRLQLGAARARLIAGALAAERGPAHTHTPISLFDLAFEADGDSEFELPASFNALVLTLEGRVHVGAEARELRPGELAWLPPETGSHVRVRGERAARVLVLSGEPIDEPVAAYGPFVMNTRAELQQAVTDYQSGKMGHLS
jgi:redox-sensitive bicupin YhaK (pirin superfamily)